MQVRDAAETSRTPVHVILNPTAGGGAAARARRELEQELARRGVAFVVRQTERRGHAVELARAAVRDGARAVIAAGGDGTIHEVANGLLRAAEEGAPMPALGVLPIGTGNDFAKLVDRATSRDVAYGAVAGGRVRHVDAGLVSWDGGSEFFVNAMGTGIDVEVVRQIERYPRLRGTVGYLLGLLRAVIGFRPVPLRIRADDIVIEENAMICAVGNSTCLGGGFHLFPDARPDDGLLDLCLIGEMDLRQVPRAIVRILRGTHGSLPMVKLMKVRSVEIEAVHGGPLYFQLDGELRSATHARIEVREHAIPVLFRPDGEDA